jgi:hypothetical protein
MKVLVCGGRDFGERYPLPDNRNASAAAIEHALRQSMADVKLLDETLTTLHTKKRFTKLIHGAAPGADTCAHRWAGSNGVPVEMFFALWAEHGHAAGPIRNQQMIEQKPDLVVAFQGGKGTTNMVKIAKLAGVRVIEVPCVELRA